MLLINNLDKCQIIDRKTKYIRRAMFEKSPHTLNHWNRNCSTVYNNAAMFLSPLQINANWGPIWWMESETFLTRWLLSSNRASHCTLKMLFILINKDESRYLSISKSLSYSKLKFSMHYATRIISILHPLLFKRGHDANDT